MSGKLEKLERDLSEVISKYGVDKMIGCDADELAGNTTTMWGLMKRIAIASNPPQRQQEGE